MVKLGGVALAVLASAAFGTSGTFASSLLDNGWSPVAVVALRVGIASLVLLGPALYAVRGRWHLVTRNLRSIGLFGLVGVAACQVMYFEAVARLSVGVALLLEYLGVLVIVLWQWLAHHVRPGRLTVAGTAFALVGLTFVLDIFGGLHLDFVGVLWGLGAAVALAGYFFISSDSDEELPAVTMSGLSMGLGAVILAVIGAAGLVPLHANTHDVVLAKHTVSWVVPILGIALIAAALAYVLGIAAARALGAKLSSFVSLTEVLFAVLFAWVLIGQVPGWLEGLGGVLIITGVALVRVEEMRQPNAAAFAPEPLATLDA